ncbi:hypothetical protein [Tateyamaria pelophila]|uniref:hypothetical protein n=1 Tax=Tateyamaria pelophila TaxID=328415 RepID=UPI001CBFACA9|nr:hypothetical protein [Tateyamaria pelophila]
MTFSAPSAKTPDHAAHKAGNLSPSEQANLWNMEEHFWTSGADNARATTAANAIMIFPYPPGILQGDHIGNHLAQNTGWRSVGMAERRAMQSGDIAILTYSVSAEKADVPIFKALCASTYLHDEGTWLRISHQQTSLA